MKASCYVTKTFFRYLSSPTTRLLIVSSKCKNAAVLEKSVNSHVTVVLYNHETVSFNSLLALICASLETNQRVCIKIMILFLNFFELNFLKFLVALAT